MLNLLNSFPSIYNNLLKCALKRKNLLKKFAATLKKFSAQGAKKVEYGTSKTEFPGYNILLPTFKQVANGMDGCLNYL